MKATLYAISISHPARAAGLMLRHKGIDARIVNLPPGSQQVALRGLGFRRGTVPALKIEGRRIQGSLEISSALEELAPQPPSTRPTPSNGSPSRMRSAGASAPTSRSRGESSAGP